MWVGAGECLGSCGTRQTSTFFQISSQIPIEAHKREKRAAQQENLKLHEMNNESHTQNSRGSPLTELHVDGFQSTVLDATQHITVS